MPNKESLKLNKYIAVSNSGLGIFRCLKKPWEVKLFGYVLSKLDYSKKVGDGVIDIDKREAIGIMGLAYFSDKASVQLRKKLEVLAKDAQFHSTDPDDENEWLDAAFMITRQSERGNVRVKLNPDALKYVSGFQDNNVLYTRIWADDLLGLNSNFSVLLYVDLLMHSDRRKKVQEWTYSTKQLKQLFGISEKAYTEEQNGRVHFRRSQFEKKTIDVASQEIQEACEKMKFLVKKELCYEKIHKGSDVTGYHFTYILPGYFPVREAEPEKSDDEVIRAIDAATEGTFSDKELASIKALLDSMPDVRSDDPREVSLLVSKHYSLMITKDNINEKGRCAYLRKMIENGSRPDEGQKRPKNAFCDFEQHHYDEDDWKRMKREFFE